jgi:DNA-binding SARP family transcriptional activator
VIAASIEEIVGRGQIGIASTYLLTYPPASLLAEHEIVRSRSAGLTMDLDGTLFHAKQAVELDGGSDASVGNLLATYFLIGDQSDAPNLAMRLAAEAQTPILRRVGEATLHLMAASLDGNTEVAAAALSDLLDHSRRLGLQHYEAVALLDLSLVRRAQGDAPAALAFAREAVEILSTVAAGSEVVASQMALAWALAHLGRLNEARSVQATAAESCTTASRLEWLVEAAQIEVSYGDETTAQSLLNEARSMTWNSAFAACNQISRVELALRVGDLAAAEALIPSRLPVSPSVETGFRARCLVVAAYTAARLGREDGQQRLEEAMAFALGQGSGLWASYADSILAATADAVDVGVRRVATHGTEYFSIVAEVWIEQLARLDTTSMASIAAEAQRRPERWQASVRRCAADPTSPNRVRAARLLDMIGDRTDVPLLRSIGRTSRHSASDRSLGRGLARRLADRVMVEDQGRVEIIVGTQVIAGTALRRKVLALLCVLLSKPKYAATRDEVVDALWPDLAPEVALNSLNQTVYFLRRVFEPGYKEDSSAGYVNHDSDLLWLDDSLIRSRSRMCRELIDSLGPDPSPSAVGELSDTYKGRFSLDFSYEEWAVPYRDALHVGYLQAIEHAVNRDIESGHYERAIGVARRALEIDPNQESLELSLLRLYRLTGAHSAAAEQYAHYSTYLREELGVDAPPLASL